MSDALPGNFEQKLARIDAIVKDLDGGDVELKRATELFKEGKTLVRECEKILKNAQDQINDAMSEQAPDAPATSDSDDQLPF